jgi:hypothetical protein
LHCYFGCLNWLKRILHVNEDIRGKHTPKLGTGAHQKRRFEWNYLTADHMIQWRVGKNRGIIYRCPVCRQPEYLSKELALEHRDMHSQPVLTS